MPEALLVKPVKKNRKVQFLKIPCIPSKHWGWSCIVIGVGCLQRNLKMRFAGFAKSPQIGAL